MSPNKQTLTTSASAKDIEKELVHSRELSVKQMHIGLVASVMLAFLAVFGVAREDKEFVQYATIAGFVAVGLFVYGLYKYFSLNTAQELFVATKEAEERLAAEKAAETTSANP